MVWGVLSVNKKGKFMLPNSTWVYSYPDNLPIFRPRTKGYALPVPETRVVCRIPKGTKVLAPWEWQVAKNNYSFCMILEANIDPTDRQRVTYAPEDYDGPRHDWYINDEVKDQTVIIRRLKKGDSELGDLLFDTYGDNAEVFEVKKVAPVIVLGQIAGDNSIQFITSESKDSRGATLPRDSYILQSAMNPKRIYFNTADKFGKLYDGIVYPGEPPTDLIAAVRESWGT